MSETIECHAYACHEAIQVPHLFCPAHAVKFADDDPFVADCGCTMDRYQVLASAPDCGLHAR